MYKQILDMIYRYQENGALQLVGTLAANQTAKEFVELNKKAFI